MGRSGSKEYIPLCHRREAQTIKPVKGKPPQAAAHCALDCFYRLRYVICGDGEYIIFRASSKAKIKSKYKKLSASSKPTAKNQVIVDCA